LGVGIVLAPGTPFRRALLLSGTPFVAIRLGASLLARSGLAAVFARGALAVGLLTFSLAAVLALALLARLRRALFFLSGLPGVGGFLVRLAGLLVVARTLLRRGLLGLGRLGRPVGVVIFLFLTLGLLFQLVFQLIFFVLELLVEDRLGILP